MFSLAVLLHNCVYCIARETGKFNNKKNQIIKLVGMVRLYKGFDDFQTFMKKKEIKKNLS